MAGFRTIVVNKRCKLESQLGMLIIRSESEKRIHLHEIETLIIESTAVALTAMLIVDLTEAGVNIIFCDRRHLPSSVFLPIHAHFSVAKNVKEQIAWNDTLKAKCWKQIVEEKIRQQAWHLSEIGKTEDYITLTKYQNTISDGDNDNYEGVAAAFYFRALFGSRFTRNDSCFQNNALNYGYTLLMATFAREIAACGYLTELGIWHKSVENPFNLASDLMEPFRILVDRLTLSIPEEQEESFKHYMLTMFSARIKINGENQSFVPAVRLYLYRIFRFMRGDVDTIFRIEFVGKEE